jgi:diguanylate cyclase (GGDEF)-like protein/PAS domain S-box-containing protein
MRRRAAAFVVAVAAQAVLRADLSATPLPDAGVPLRRIADIKALASGDAARGRTVSIEAVVTYYHHEWEMLFVEDESGAIFVYVDHRQPEFSVREGHRVAVVGKTVPGDFAPSITQPRLTPLGYSGRPRPPAPTLKDLATGAFDGRFIEVRGIVRQAAPVDDMLEIVLMLQGGKLKVHVRDYDEHADFAALVDAQVRVRGVCTTRTNEQRLFLGAEVWAADFAQDVVVVEPAPADPFGQSAMRIEDLRRHAFAGGHSRRLKLEGVVSAHQPGRGAFIQDASDGVFVETPQKQAFQPGDRVQALGFLSDSADRHVVEDGLIRRLSAGPAPLPAALTAAQAVEGRQEARLVRLAARFVGRIDSSGDEVLVFQDGETVFQARWAAPGATRISELKAGSLVQVIGAASRVAAAAGASGLQLLLRTPEDLVVLGKPSWWTAERIRLLLEVTAGVFVAALAWAGVLRRRVRQQQEALQETRERFALVVQGTNDGVWDWDLRTDRMYFSPRWKAMLGYAEADVSDRAEEWLRLVHQEDRERLRGKLQMHRDGATPYFEHEHRMLHKDGGYRWMLSRGFALRDAAGTAYRMAGAQTDVNDRRSYDALTGLPNKALFLERVERALARARHPGGELFAVLFLDLDRFKNINDSLGHLAGDRLLVGFGQRLETCVRPSDMIARFGGDEFALLVHGISDAGEAAHVAERIHKALRLPFEVAGHEIYASGSIGIALSATGYEHAEELLRDADTAMYRAKGAGRARFEVFDQAMREHVTAVMRTENDLRRALDRDELRAHYQPIVDLQSGEIRAFEALVRWQHPERGLLAPAEFVPLAEETGLVVPMGEWMLRKACAQARAFCRRFPELSVHVNLSARQLGDSRLVERVRQALADSGLDPHKLVLEITETALMESADTAVLKVAALKELGIRLHLDDFGTGYSSLSYLHRFPIDALKVDRSFVSRMVENEDACTIVRSILGLAHSLRLTVIAEGVETEEQARLLRNLGCDQAQGHLFCAALELPTRSSGAPARPSAAAAASAWEICGVHRPPPGAGTALAN